MAETSMNDTVYRTVNELIKKHISITSMESVTGGMLANLITDCEGSSSVFKGSYVTYSNESKIKAGVDATVIDQYGVYSAECAKAMAHACKMAFKADIGIGITGVLKNIDPANTEGEPGRVFYAIEYEGNTVSECLTDVPLLSRSESKLYICRKVMETVKTTCL